MRLTWPLVGRARELRFIEAAMSDPTTSGAVICGPSGVGKSRVAREALAAVASGGREVRWVVGTSCGRGLPLGALASWAGLGGGDSLQLVCEVIESLTAAPSDAPVVIGVDDPHLLDDLSMFVLQQIVARGVGKLLLTERVDEPIPAAVQELWKLGQFERIDLPPLSPEQTTVLLSETLVGSIESGTASGLWKLTRGNALYLRHIVEQAVADKRLVHRDGYWQWTGEPLVPPGLVELVESRIGDLPVGVADVIDALAVGEPIELAAMHRITSPEAVEEADLRGLIRLDDMDDRLEVWVAHPLYGEVRRKTAAQTRLRRLRGLVVGELAAADNRDDMRVVVRRGALSLDSDLEPDADLLMNAARGAICLGDLALAERLAKAGDRAGGGPEAVFLRAHALSWLGRGVEAEEVLAAVGEASMTDDERARFTYLRASNLLWALAEPDRAEDVIGQGAAGIGDGPARTSIDAVRGVYLFAADRPAEALAALESLVLGELPPIVGAETAWALTTIYADAGRTAKAVAAAEAGYEIAVRCSDMPHMRFNIADSHLTALVLAGRIGEASELAQWASGQAADLPGTAHLLGPAIAGRAALAAGRLVEARELLEQAAGALSATGHAQGWGYRYGIPRAAALAMCGRWKDAAAVLEHLTAVRRPFRTLSYEKSLAQAWVSAGQGAVSEAMTMLQSAAETACANGRFGAAVMCLQTAAQFGDRTCEQQLRELEGSVEGPRVGAAARFASAVHQDNGVELTSVSEAFEEMGDDVAAAEASGHAALAYRRHDLRGSALGCAARAEALAAGCGAETPTLAQAREPLPLTDREREIVLLIGQGLSSRDVAERLTLSRRTVEGHIYRAMAKTGTATREELARLLWQGRSGDDD
jgi:DNA-binding CsgD family transcriptional regulator/tetratricopeptide (TPR) repeat protein